MIRLVNDLSNVSKIESNPAAMLDRSQIYLRELLESVINEQQSIAMEKHINVNIDQKLDEKTVITANKEKLYQAFMNLINNAIKYSPKNSEVFISCKNEKKSVTIGFRDSGIGIPKDQQARVFQKFFRADNAVKSIEIGSGLGLYFVKTVIEAHGGKIWFVSEQNKGTTFYVSLPV